MSFMKVNRTKTNFASAAAVLIDHTVQFAAHINYNKGDLFLYFLFELIILTIHTWINLHLGLI